MFDLRTAAEAKAWLDQQGKSVQDFAREHDLDASTTYQVLAGVKKGRRGKAHAAAVALGIKAGTQAIAPHDTGESFSDNE